jgi:diguanylate cyclase (GGDEF)-like protein
MTEDSKLESEGVVGYIDIDDFKNINDSYGHDFGDEVIKTVYKIGSDVIGNNGKFLREYGQGDEFLVILPEFDKSPAEDIFQEIRDSIVDAEPNGVEVTVSIGLAISSTGEDEFEEIKNLAEEAMRWAKQWGGNQVQIYGEFEPIDKIEIMFDLQSSPGRPDDQLIIEKWRKGAQSDLRAEIVRNETTGARYESEGSSIIKSQPSSEECIRAVVSKIETVNRRGVKFTANIKKSQYDKHIRR